MLELLLPAGNLKKLKTAFHFGADAVYLGGKSLSLRAFADNFSNDEIIEAVKYAHERGKKVYVTANIFAHEADLGAAKDFFVFLEEIGADAVLISDIGLLALCREVAPSLCVHISTQANTLNSQAVKFFKTMGASRVVLARELSIDEIATIATAVPDIELEAFCHGAMCVSYSGRCLLSSYFTGRSANRGECAQPCRWSYRLVEEQNGASPLLVEEDDNYTYFLSSKDLCLLPRIPDLARAGVRSLKVEGRMKSEFYIATVAAAYRAAIDEFESTGKIENLASYQAALERASHRPFTQGFADGKPNDSISYDCSRTVESDIFAATVLSYADGRVTVEMRNRFKKGYSMTTLSPRADLNNKNFVVGDIELVADGSVTDDAKLVQSVYRFDCPYPLLEGDLLVLDKRQFV